MLDNKHLECWLIFNWLCIARWTCSGTQYQLQPLNFTEVCGRTTPFVKRAAQQLSHKVSILTVPFFYTFRFTDSVLLALLQAFVKLDWDFVITYASRTTWSRIQHHSSWSRQQCSSWTIYPILSLWEDFYPYSQHLECSLEELFGIIPPQPERSSVLAAMQDN